MKKAVAASFGRLTRLGLCVHRAGRRLNGQFGLPTVVIVAVVSAALSVGAVLIPLAAATRAAGAGADSVNGVEVPDTAVASVPAIASGGVSAAGGVLASAAASGSGAAPGSGAVGSSAPSTPASRRPAADAIGTPAALAGWAAPLAARLGIPVPAMQAYGHAQLVVAAAMPSCRLQWTTLAGIGKVESNHGQSGHTALGADGRALPPILGPVLDGSNGNRRISDTDGGRLDGDTVFDRAVGPMQFIPTTWQTNGVDGDGDGVADPNDIYDAALTAARYLCAGGRDLSTAGGWRAAILSYNTLDVYVAAVFTAANDYGVRSHG